jgi:D-amino-acid dehydrogenase
MNDQAPVIVVGAGIVGTATARALQRAGHSVTLLDSAEPGRATS